MSTRETPTVRLDPTAATAAIRAPEAATTDLVLDRYRLGRRLGTGAFGTVFAARDERLERDVAVKVLPRDRVIGGRFEREARAAARLQHPAIVTLYEAAVDDDGAYLVSELVRGRTLDRLLAEGHLSDRSIVEIAISLCDALGHAHEQGVVHRDVKPSNVLIPARPTSPLHPAKLTDFGIASIVGGDTLTRTGDVIGTAAYMAPEQAAGREATPAADLYALAVVVYEALTGVNPLRHLRVDGARRLAAHLPPLRRQRRDLPRELGIAIDRALRPRPRERGTIGDIRAGLVASLPQASELTGVVAPLWSRTAGDRPEELPGPTWREDRRARAGSTGPTAGGAATTARGKLPSGAGAARAAPVRSLRTAAAVVAGGAAACVAVRLLGSPRIPPLTAGLVVGGAVFVLPRLGWLATVAALALLCVAEGHPGAATAFGTLAVVTVVVLLPFRGLWPLPVGAVALGLGGIAGAWPAIVGLSGLRVVPRALVAAAGYVWVAAAGALLGRPLLWLPAGLPRPDRWVASAPTAWQHVLLPLLSPSALAGALVWGAAAVLLPWVARGGLLRAAALVATWSAATALGIGAVSAGHLHGLVAGAVAAWILALVPRGWDAVRAPGIPQRVA